ncbi:MAG: hypothetical protein A2Z32_01860 [Chloroflexi bacterium RBG_16_69_14]|nr:MAG: hypothetical protein A2Z32_01860 [Chloroflexi bacterium RBG_16_69_14]
MAKREFRFELERLASYGQEDVLGELRRVAALVPGPSLTAKDFERHSKVSRTKVNRMFGGWHEALIAAGLGERYSGRRVTPKMRWQQARLMTAEDMAAELRRVADSIGRMTLSMEEFSDLSPIINAAAVKSWFGSWAWYSSDRSGVGGRASSDPSRNNVN